MGKFHKKYFIPVLLLASFSCTEKLTEHKAIRRVVNETASVVKVKVYDNDESPYFFENIEASHSIEIKGSCFTGAETYCDMGWQAHAAFAKIYFGTEKIQTFEMPYDIDEKYINANPQNGMYGYEKTNENGIEVYTYRITPEDYDKAKDCDGHCD